MAKAPKSEESKILPESSATLPRRRKPVPRRRKGAILVVAAGGMIVLLLFAAYAVDVGKMILTRAQAENATRAAAWAGYERLKKLNFAVAGNETEIDTTIRRFLVRNGASDTEAAAATVDFNRRGQVTVEMTMNTGLTFSHFWGQKGKVSAAIAGQGKIITNKLTPFAVPSTYQDPDRDGYTNWNISDETIDLTTNPWRWKVGNPYIIKFGRDSGQPGNDADWIYIPMDDDYHDITIDGAPYRIPAVTNQDTSWSTTSGGYSTRAQVGKKSQNGFLRPYGIAYDVAGVADANIYWTLGYDGGGFLIEEAHLLAATDSGGKGYTIGSESYTGTNSYTVPIYNDGTYTGVTALRLRSKLGGTYRSKDLGFLERLDLLTAQGKINLLKIPKQPKIVTFTGGNDNVTESMTAAGIPFRAVFYGVSTSGFFDFSISTSDTVTQLTNKLLDTAGTYGGPFDWLHLHHENFATGTSGSPYANINLAGAIEAFVRVHKRFMFSACWASESLEVALAKYGSPNWTTTGAVPELHVADHGADPLTQKIEYTKTFAFTDFYGFDGSASSSSGVAGGPVLGSETRYRDSTDCSSNCFDQSEIDNEYGNVNAMYLDYLNPLLQNHGGFGGYELIEETEVVSSTYVGSDYIRARSGKTDSFRYKGDGYAHCPPNKRAPDLPTPDTGELSSARNNNGSYSGYLIERDYNNSGTSHAYYTDPQPYGEVQLWARESNFDKNTGAGCDINGDGDETDYIRVKDLVNYGCPCGPSYAGSPFATAEGGGVYRMQNLNCDSNKNDWVGPNVLYEEELPLQLCATAHSHVLFKPHVFATGGYTTAQDIAADPDKRVMILTRALTSDKNNLSTLKYAKYLSGTADDDNNLENGFGRWSFLGGHSASYLNGDSSSRMITGRREYLNNILFGSTQGIQPGGAFTPGTGAVNPGGIGLGGTGGTFGATGGFTGSSFSALFRVGAQGIGIPVGAKFATAPGNFEAPTSEGEEFMFKDEANTRTSVTWASDGARILALGTTDLEAQLNEPQVVVVPVVERIIDDPATLPNPTPEAALDDYLYAGSAPALAANATARAKSMYGGDITLGEDHPDQARALHVIGFHKFFIIDKDNQAPDTQDEDPSLDSSFVAATWRDAEIRGYYLGPYTAFPTPLEFPTTPTPDPR